MNFGKIIGDIKTADGYPLSLMSLPIYELSNENASAKPYINEHKADSVVEIVCHGDGPALIRIGRVTVNPENLYQSKSSAFMALYDLFYAMAQEAMKVCTRETDELVSQHEADNHRKMVESLEADHWREEEAAAG